MTYQDVVRLSDAGIFPKISHHQSDFFNVCLERERSGIQTDYYWSKFSA